MSTVTSPPKKVIKPQVRVLPYSSNIHTPATTIKKPGTKIITDLSSLGFRVSESAPKTRMVLMTIAKEKVGKTHFALSAPAPIAYINFDDGYEGVMHKFDREKRVYQADVERPPKKMTPEKAKAVYGEIWTKVKEQIEGAVENPEIRTLVIDTATEAWEYCRMAHFGKLTQVMPQHYAAPKAEFRDLIRYVFSTNKNAVFIHKVKKEYKEGADGKSNFTGKYQFAGFDEMGFLCEATLEHYRKDVKGQESIFGFRVLESRHETKSLVGMEFEEEMANFAVLGLNMFPESNEEDWQ